MDAYSVRLTTTAQKELDKLPNDILGRVREWIGRLAKDPFPRQAEKLSNRDEHRIRVGAYRIVYEVYKRERLVLLHRIRHRREVYRGL